MVSPKMITCAVSRTLLFLGICILEMTNSLEQPTDPDVQEYCEWESFNATCGQDEVIMIHGARYGRMALGRCITKNYGNIGCGTDVTSDFDSECSGKRQCIISVISLHNKRSCPKDFKSYLEAGYKCLKVFNPETSTCPESGKLTLPSSSGHFSSLTTVETGLGNRSCPLVIEVQPHQHVNLTLVDLSVSVGSNHWFYTDSGNLPANCENFATIQERDGSVSRTICGGRAREAVVYTSRTNYLEIRLSTPATKKHRFLLKYEAFGCPPVEATEHAYSQTYGDHVVVRCNSSDEAWYLTCRGTEWVGQVGNCTPTLATGSANNWSLSIGVSDFPLGILIVVTLGVAIGVAIGVMMLVAVLAYMKRRRHRKIRSRSNYVLKQVQESHPGTPKFTGTETVTLTTDRTPMLSQKNYEYTERLTAPGPMCPGTLTRQYLDTWQRTRPLPVPRPTSDSGIDQETDGLTMTPETPSPSIFTTFRPDFERTLLSNRHLNAHRPSEIGEHVVAPYYFKVSPSMHAMPPPNDDYDRAGKPDVLSTCNLCRNNTQPKNMTNV